MNTITRSPLLLVLLIALSGCGGYKVTRFYPEIIPKEDHATLTIHPHARQQANVTYMGCGNLFIEKDGQAIMFDPFFSIQGIVQLAGRIKTKQTFYDLWKSNLQRHVARSAVRATLVSHTHYDHVMDLPTLLHDKYFPVMNNVYGNNYLPVMMTNFQKSGATIEAFTDAQTVDGTMDNQYAWISPAPNIRFLPIRSTHAPHTKRKLFMSKPLKPGYFEKHLTWPGDKVGAFKWTVGDSYSFLVDIIGPDTLRIFVQTSASEYPAGAPPARELSRKPVDLAIFCYASSLNVSNYPNVYVDFMMPSKVMFVHWEDFFSPSKSGKDLRLVRRTRPEKVRKQVDRLGMKKDQFIMPRPGTKVTISY